MRHLVVGTAGHIDHGKSTLVHALTGIDPDRLKDEKARGITIELGFADLDLGDGRVVSFVDVPGHERFVRHMVAGASGIDAVILVVAADAGIQPQTREHLDICRLLGVEHGIVALSKIDLVDGDLREVVELEIHEAIAGTFREAPAVVAVSTREGRGLDDLRDALVRLFDTVPSRNDRGVMRLPVDRSFVLRGFGTVVTGTLASGSVREGQEVEILPAGARARVRGLQVHRTRVERGTAGRRTAVNLQGVSTEEVPRGSMVVEPGALRTTRRMWARVDWLEHVPEALRSGGLVRIHHGTAECAARFRVLARRDDGASEVELFLERPVPAVPGDRFILRQTAPLDTLGGGIVVDARPPRGRGSRRELGELIDGDERSALTVRVRRAGGSGIPAGDLAVALGIPAEEVEGRLDALASAQRVCALAGRWFDGPLLTRAEEALVEALTRYHEREPLQAGIPRERLRATVRPDMPVESWRVWLDVLVARGRIRVEGDRVASASHEVLLSPRDRERLDRIELRFLEAGLEPPEVDAVVRDVGESTDRFVEMLIESGKLVRLRDGRPFHAGALEGLRERLREYAATSRTIDVATFKEMFGVTRKNAIPLLEHLDGERCTRRVGNVREILMR